MLATVIISIVLIVMVAAIIRKLYRDKKQGVSSCGGGCSGCPHASACHKETSVYYICHSVGCVDKSRQNQHRFCREFIFFV